MSYNITKTDNTTLVTVNDTELNSDYGVVLVGKNYSGYGVYLNDNFVRLMENFAKASSPAFPLAGQLWYDTNNKVINLYNNAGWKSLAALSTGTSAPSATTTQNGDLWWDTTNQQLKAYAADTFTHTSSLSIYNTYEIQIESTADLQLGDQLITSGGNLSLTSQAKISQIVSAGNIRINTPTTILQGETVTFYRGNGWNVIGPAYSVTQGITGVVSKTIQDSLGQNHVIAIGYVQDKPVFISSRDNEFTPTPSDAIDGWTTIKPGINLHAGTQQVITKTVSSTVAGSAGTTVIPVSSTVGLQAGDIIISANIIATAGRSITNIFSSNSAVLINAADVFSEDETISFQRGTIQNYQFHGTATNAQLFDNVSSDRYARRDQNETFTADVTLTAGNLYVSNVAVTDDTTGNITVINDVVGASIAFQSNVIGSGPTTVLTINGLNGEVQTAADPVTDMGVVTKQYSDAQLLQSSLWLNSNVVALIGTDTPADRQDFGNISLLANSIMATAGALASDVALKAYILSPTFEGNPQSVTAQAGDNSPTIATTAFVYTAVDNLAQATTANAIIQENEIATKAPIDSPTFVGAARAPTPSDSDQSTLIATTRFVSNLIGTLQNITNTQLALKAPLDSAQLTGIPTAPTAARYTDTTQIATTAYVMDQTRLKANLIGADFTGTVTVPLVTSPTDNSTKVPNTNWVRTYVTTYGTVPMWSGSNKYVSTSAPTANDGANGDFWFQYTP